MSLLSGVTRGKQKLPHLLLLYGPDGIGKSTFGSQAPNPIFLGPEKGTMNLDVARFPSPKNWSMVLQACDELLSGTHDFKTLVVDTLDWMEPLIYEHICKKYETNSIEKAAGGYGKGFTEAFNECLLFRDKLSAIRENKKMNVILLAHSKIVDFQDPATESGYGRYELKLQESKNVSMKAMWREYVDAVLFCNFETFSKGEGKQARGITTRERKIWTERNASFDAKNRFGLPFEIPLDYASYDALVNAAKTVDEAPAIISRILELTAKIQGDDDLKSKVMEQVEKHSNNAEQLSKIENRLKTKIGE